MFAVCIYDWSEFKFQFSWHRRYSTIVMSNDDEVVCRWHLNNNNNVCMYNVHTCMSFSARLKHIIHFDFISLPTPPTPPPPSEPSRSMRPVRNTNDRDHTNDVFHSFFCSCFNK